MAIFVSLVSHALTLTMLGGPSGAPSFAAVARTASAAEPEDAFRELTAKAKEQRAAQDHAEAARSFAAAYDALSEEEQAGLKGEITVSNAVDDFRRAQEEAPDDMMLLIQEGALLGRYESNPQRQGEMTPELAEELTRVEARLEVLRKEAGPSAEPATTVSEPSSDVTPSTSDDEPAAPAPKGRDTVGLVLLGTGVTSLVGGVALIGGGAWVLRAADERRDDQLTALDAGDYPDEAGLRDALSEWHQRGRSLGTGLVVGGVVLAGAGIGLTAWGVLRMRKHAQAGRRAHRVTPMISGHALGLTTTVAF